MGMAYEVTAYEVAEDLVQAALHYRQVDRQSIFHAITTESLYVMIFGCDHDDKAVVEYWFTLPTKLISYLASVSV